MNQLIYDFGCGSNKRPNTVGIDLSLPPVTDADIKADISHPDLCLPSDKADGIYCFHVLEHIPYPYNLQALTNILRVLKVGGWFELRFPHPGSDAAMVPDHKHTFSQRYIDDVFRKDTRMEIISIELIRTPYFQEIRNQFLYLSDDTIEKCFRNTVDEIRVKGIKL